MAAKRRKSRKDRKQANARVVCLAPGKRQGFHPIFLRLPRHFAALQSRFQLGAGPLRAGRFNLPAVQPLALKHTTPARLATRLAALAGCALAAVSLLAAGGPHDWRAVAGGRLATLAVPSTGQTGFVRLNGADTGLLFTNRLSNERSITNRNLLSGAGVAAGDVDDDGWCDLFFCGLDGDNALFRNRGGWRFEDITAASGAALPGLDCMAAVLADVDGDGDLDLIVNTLGDGPHVLANDGRGRFTDVTDAAGVRARTGGMSLALADVDDDSDLDLYVVNYRTTTVMDQPTTTFRISLVNNQPVVATVNGEPATAPHLTNRFVIAPGGEVLELGEPDALYLNDGRGRFTAVSWTGGAFLDEDGQPLADAPRDWGLSVQMRDTNGDGAPDIYVCNDLFSPDRFWINDGRGRFRAIDRLALRATSTFSMGVDFGDLDRDGDVDFMIVDMLGTSHKDRHTQVSTQKPTPWPIGLIDNRPQVWRNTLHVNRGDHTYAEVSFYAGVEASNWSWMPLFVDVDLDGFEDVLIPNGQMRDFQNVDMQNRIEAARAARQLTQADIIAMVTMFPDFSTPSVVFRNRGDWTFEEMQGRWGFHDRGIAQGTALADLDGDGDLDVVVNKLNEQAGVYRNDSPAPRLAVRLRGPPGNVQGVGGRITVIGGPVRQGQEIISGGHYLSGAEPLRMFAAGRATNRLDVEILWRDGRRSLLSGVPANTILEVDATGAGPAGPPPPTAPEPWFQDVSDRLRHEHHEDPFDDFERQPLLAQRLSQLGPGVAWHDFNGDGWEDLVIASGRGGATGFFRNDGRGGFVPVRPPAFTRPVQRDQTTVLGVGETVFIGAANYEDGQTNGGCLRVYDLRRQAAGESVLGPRSSTGPLAFGDVDGDGTLELFIGGRVVPGRYPEPADSQLLRNEGGRFVPVRRFEKLGLVSGAVFTDLTGDGLPELVLACEWGPVRLFRSDRGAFTEWNPPLRWPGNPSDPPSGSPPAPRPSTIAELTGWWTGINTADLDSDGRQDLIAANWGLNHRWRDASPKQPRRLYFGDLDESGGVQLVEARFEPTMNAWVPERGLLPVLAAMPFIQERIRTFEDYGTSSLEQIYGERLARTARLEVNTPASMVFLNRGDHFEPRPLPAEAQWSPAFGVTAGDFDGDGHDDVFLSQNFFAVALDYTRYDAGRGLLLRGDGRGNLTPVPGQESGLKVYGEQRGCAAADFDHDGRLDLAVTQNGAATKLYRNLRARPGLPVRLAGPPGNPAGFGAVLRLGDGRRWGPAREIHGGAGYWSLDAASPVLTFDGEPTHLQVRWPGGATATLRLPSDARAVEINPDGSIRAL
jgi:hypothetical protein